ncbi:MAG TPA: hypothetical protein VLZ30_04365 [Verrucomicrobiae bacterium]|nr:hypothetical protein [Verrucomicrobiae bacterium]
MNRALRFIVPTVACLLLASVMAARAEDKKVDPTGTWVWTVPARDGGTRQVYAKLKFGDGKLAGVVSGRNGEIAIEDAKLTGDEVSFKVTREFNGTKFVQTFSGKVSADTITGKVSFDVNGEPQTVDWNAKKGEVKPAEPVAKPVEPAPKPAQP